MVSGDFRASAPPPSSRVAAASRCARQNSERRRPVVYYLATRAGWRRANTDRILLIAVRRRARVVAATVHLAAFGAISAPRVSSRSTRLPLAAGSLRVIRDPRHIWEIAVMKTHTRALRSLNLGSGAHRRRVGERQGRPARLYSTLAVVLALSSSLVHAQTPTCAAPGCNSVASDSNIEGPNTATGTTALFSLSTGSNNTASGWRALYSNTTGSNNSASGAGALGFNTTGNYNTASGDPRNPPHTLRAYPPRNSRVAPCM
jgi:hypothetical protein